MKDCVFIQQIDEHVLKPYRNENLLSREVERYFELFSKKYNSNPHDERDKLLFCVCECFLNFNDGEKLNEILTEYCRDFLEKDVEITICENVESFLNSKIGKKQYSKSDILSIMTCCNFMEILGKEYGEITLLKFTEETSVKVSAIQQAIELLKIYIQQRQKQMTSNDKIAPKNTINNKKIVEKDNLHSFIEDNKRETVTINNNEEEELLSSSFRDTRSRKRRRINKKNKQVTIDEDYCYLDEKGNYDNVSNFIEKIIETITIDDRKQLVKNNILKYIYDEK